MVVEKERAPACIWVPRDPGNGTTDDEGDRYQLDGKRSV